jgi:aminoglycoside phosphotransferase (APT) family kinase protein
LGASQLGMTSVATTSAQANAEAGAVRQNYRLEEASLDRWMRDHVDRYRGPLEVLQFKGGQSNPTYKLVTPERNYVLRRKPSGPLVKGAHAVDREARVLQAVGSAGYPVPEVYGVCTNDAVLGSWFYVMEHVEGRIFWDATFADVPGTERPRYFEAMNATLARLHGLEYEEIGLADYGRPGNYFQRQLARWTEAYLSDQEAGRDPDMDWLLKWLPTAIPEDEETRLVHGDFRCDNLIFHPSEPRIIAVLDWELSTLGNPIADFAYHALMYRLPADIIAGLGGMDPTTLSIPNEREYVALYCNNTRREKLAKYEFYVAFNLFRLAAIFHGIKGRVARGTASSAHAAARAASYPRLARLAVHAAEVCT